ncbi:MAG: type II toxin-antitoxin system RelB/DinJ family antitoxin [Candidatus Nomurabacteria bacterium]|nr:type II toxin-antitoxin system RelB/DinJ family antitoxin [Candidatus Nomurabacteria bacterium]
MNNTVINFNTNSKLKKEAKKVLDEMGLTLSVALNASLRRIIAEKRIEFTVPEIPNARLKRSFKNADKMIKGGKYKIYKTHEDLEKALFS